MKLNRARVSGLPREESKHLLSIRSTFPVITNMTTFKLGGLILLGSLVLATVGCGEGSDLNLVRVSGTVTHKGQPLEGAQITFIPDPSSLDARPGSDVTGPEGNYIAQTNGRTGLVPGKYKVVISKIPTLVSEAAPGMEDDPHMVELASQGAGSPGALRNKSAGAALAKIEEEFEAEVPPEGGIRDFNLKK